MTHESPAQFPLSQLPRVLGRYGGDTPGPLVIGIGGMHGNEPAGVFALQQVLQRLRSLNPPFRGELVGLVGNRAALARNCRYINEDFNRLWLAERLLPLKEHGQPAKPISEDKEQQELLAAIETLLEQQMERQQVPGQGPVVFLDLHTTSADGTPFVVIGDTLLNRRFAFRLDAPVILGLEEQLDGTLLNYLSDLGYVAIGFEGGQHASPAAVENHEAAIWSVLATAGCIRSQDIAAFGGRGEQAGWGKPNRPLFPPALEIRHHHVIQDGDEFVMKPGFTNFQPVERGQLLARDRRGQILASEAGQILMPLYQGQGTDGFFLVREVRPVWLRLAAWLRRLQLERLLPVLPGVRRHPDQTATLVVNPRVARWFVLEIFHLLGFRRKRPQAGKLIVSRRWHAPCEFEEW